jgi:hypothetical protein
MEITLKNVKFYESMSEETNCFQADVYANGVKFASVKNNGQGGSTALYHNGNLELFKTVEKYCESLPPIKCSTFEIKSTLENVVDDIFEKWLDAKLNAKQQKKLAKDCAKGLCYGHIDHYTTTTWGKYTIEQLLTLEKGREVIYKKIAELKAKGIEILNTNIPKTQ